LLNICNAAADKIEDDLDVLKVIKNLRELRIAVGSKLLNEKLRF
jgi:hypothetical protein